MARLPRLVVPGFPHHLIQRGNNRQNIFVDDQDRQRLLALLGECAQRYRVSVHGYVLMDNHLHLLVTPIDAEGLPRLMQAVGRRYVQAFNARHQRSGTLFEGRYRAAPVQTDRYLLACMVYLDLNPVRARMVTRPAEFQWSSYGHYVGLRSDRLITPHPVYWQLGNTPFEREAQYAERVAQGINAEQGRILGGSAAKGWALGEPAFLAELEARSGRRVSPRRAGRPAGSGGAKIRSDKSGPDSAS